jgi:hypothetical protein
VRGTRDAGYARSRRRTKPCRGAKLPSWTGQDTQEDRGPDARTADGACTLTMEQGQLRRGEGRRLHSADTLRMVREEGNALYGQVISQRAPNAT